MDDRWESLSAEGGHVIQAFWDGGIPPKNPGGIPVWGIVVYQDGKVIQRGHGLAAEPFGPMATNNVAEYKALINAMVFLLVFGLEKETVQLCGDSQLIVKQVNREFACRDEKLFPLWAEAVDLFSRFADVELVWVPRKENEADEEARKGYIRLLKKKPEYVTKVAELSGKTEEEVWNSL